ncbi:MAG: hypothetical protein G01um101416_1203 [Microgenomates group bacterium Gr01-1014_16]|nr:MAG: hypothetical protein G01um101416_1203 [Microgenomates group bacterium Gr01-1014_16]
MKNRVLLTLFEKPQTVFTLGEVALLFGDVSYDNLKQQMAYYVKQGAIKKLRRGVYAKKSYNVLELANKLYSPSYISLETVLAREGVIFQYYGGIYAVSYLSRTVKVDGNEIVYRKIKNEILVNKAGIREGDWVMTATLERAFLDAVFLFKDYHFDNLRPLNWDKIGEIRKIYGSKIFNRRVDEYYQIYKEEHA